MNPDTILPELCAKCQKPLDGMRTADQLGWKHPWCFEQDHPFVPLDTFADVVNTSYDPVLSRRLILRFVPINIGGTILMEYNRLALAQWERRCEEF